MVSPTTKETKRKLTAQASFRTRSAKSWLSAVDAWPVIIFLTLLAGFLLVWQLSVRLGLVSSMVPAPTEVSSKLVLALSDPFYNAGVNDVGIGLQLLASLRRVLVGFLLAMVVALPVGFVVGMSSVASRAVDPFIQVLRPVSPLAWLPIGLALLRDSERTAIFVIFISALWPMLLNTMVATSTVPRTYLEVARTLRASPWTTLRRVVIPAALPEVITGLRLSMGVAWLVIIAAEMLIGGRGIGYFVWNEWNNLDIANIIVGILLIGVVGLGLDRIFKLLEERWRYER